jgi:hypothetical protein
VPSGEMVIVWGANIYFFQKENALFSFLFFFKSGSQMLSPSYGMVGW